VKLAIVHDWLTGMRGGEKCLEIACDLYPQAEVVTLLHVPGSVSPRIESHVIRTSGFQRLPGVARHYRAYLGLMPRAIEQLDLRGYDAVLSMSHCVAKSAPVPRGVPHVCYCFTPMRYVWDMYEAYFGRDRVPPGLRWGVWRLARWLRDWDRRTASRVGHFVAISRFVQDRIRRCYGRDSQVIHPPVDTRLFRPGGKVEDYYLCVSAFAPYKRLDVAIEAFNRLGRTLKIVGKGQDGRRLQRLAGPNVEFLGWQPDEVLCELYRGCQALVFPGEEDFGITPLEAQACGRPVLALGRGGVLETVVPWAQDARAPTGLFFQEQTPEAVVDAVHRFESVASQFRPEDARARAETFSQERYRDALARCLEDKLGISPAG